MALIETENLTFQYALGDKPALDDVSLSIDEGELILLFGSSGCGKTTLLRHFKHELWPEGRRSGRILYEGKPMEQIKPERLASETGMVMQNPESQIVTDVVWHELAFGLENLGVDPDIIRRRVAEMASFFGIGAWFHRKTSELSGGQKQMLNLASTLALQPRLLLLDEPTSMLDPVSSREFLEMVTRLNRELGITVVMTGHRLDEAFHLATRAVYMKTGKVEHIAGPRNFGGYLKSHPEVRLFMPASVRIYMEAEKDSAAGYPLTVREGKRYLERKLYGKKAELPSRTGDRESNAVISCENVWYRYAKNAPYVLKGLSVAARPGEITCILGENGSGKSTLLSLLAGLLKPAHGKIRLFGKNMTGMKNRELYLHSLALLPQNVKPLFVRDSLLEDLQAAARAAGTEEEIGSVTETLGLGQILARHPYDLSGGESQKAALGKLLLTHPKILLLDEPTKGLDALAREDLAEILRNLCGQGVCVVLITHDVEFAAEYASECVLLFDGGVACRGTPVQFFGGNFFYTTAANRMAREINNKAITCGDVLRLCGNVQ